ncbi:hypothetical protein [Streptomyces abikoensis]|uniref:Aminoglycoside phosphotransferase n=1 Tax=Streptomyces abikoensis TaxID=97398 RepID=A0ABW7T9K7_9ACTN
MRAQHADAARALGVTCDTEGEFWGWAGRTLGAPGTDLDGRRVWLRLVSAPTGKAAGKTWEGAETAQKALGDLGGHRPALLAVHDVSQAGVAYRAELSEHMEQPVISSDPVLRAPIGMSSTWWADLRTALDMIAITDTERVAVRQEYIDRALPEFLGIAAPQTIGWSTAHGDLHWANLTAPQLRLLDWEGWGRAPYGYDQATLLAYSLLESAAAEHVRQVFPELGTAATWAGEAVIVAELLQTIGRGHNEDLAGPLHRWADQLRSSRPSQ